MSNTETLTTYRCDRCHKYRDQMETQLYDLQRTGPFCDCGGMWVFHGSTYPGTLYVRCLKCGHRGPPGSYAPNGMCGFCEVTVAQAHV